MVGRPSRLSEVAIYPDPERFFVDGTGDKDVNTQESMAQKDGENLRERLKASELDVIIPDEASTLTELTFRHLDGTGEWLFSKRYAEVHGLRFIYGRTKNPTNEDGSYVANVGRADPDHGLIVDYWRRDDGYGLVLATRLVVPKR